MAAPAVIGGCPPLAGTCLGPERSPRLWTGARPGSLGLLEHGRGLRSSARPRPVDDADVAGAVRGAFPSPPGCGRASLAYAAGRSGPGRAGACGDPDLSGLDDLL